MLEALSDMSCWDRSSDRGTAQPTDATVLLSDGVLCAKLRTSYLVVKGGLPCPTTWLHDSWISQWLNIREVGVISNGMSDTR